MEFRDLRNELGKERWACPFPPFEVSESEKQQLVQLAADIVRVGLDEYEEFLYVNHSTLNDRDWKFLRRDHQCETFVRRREKYGLKGFGTKKRFRRDSDTSASASSTQSDEITSLDVTDIRTIGVTHGTKEDAVYGVMNPTTIIMRVKSAYVDDKIEDCNVFSIIQNASHDDPFTTLSLRWRVTENPPVFNLLVKSYDHVYLDATGVTKLSNGEEVTYQFLHSVDFPKATPALPQFSRGQAAGIAFWRQVDDDLVSIWARGVYTVPFERARTLFQPVIGAAQAKSVMNNFHAAQMKKLRWAIHRRQAQGETEPASSSNVCIVCTKKRTIRLGDKCELCGQHVCGACAISHKLAAVDDTNKLRWTKARVCSFCMAKVVKMDAAEAVRIELDAGEYDRIN